MPFITVKPEKKIIIIIIIQFSANYIKTNKQTKKLYETFQTVGLKGYNFNTDSA